MSVYTAEPVVITEWECPGCNQVNVMNGIYEDIEVTCSCCLKVTRLEYKREV